MRRLEARDLQVWLLFFYGFGNACTYSLARTVADSTYLSRVGSERLPEVYLLSAGVVALAAMLHAAAVRWIGLRATIVLTLVCFSISSVTLATLLQVFPTSLAVLTTGYFIAQIRGTLGTIHFATVLNEQFDSRKLRKVVGFIGVGATIAGFTTGTLVGVLSDYWYVESFLNLAAFVDLLTILPLVILRRVFQRERQEVQFIAEASEPVGHAGRRVPRWSLTASKSESRHIWTLVSIVALSIVAVTLVEYRWKVGAAQWWSGNDVGLTKYFGFFYGGLYLMTGLLQLTLTKHLLRANRILIAVAALPTALLLGASGALAAASQLWVFVALTFCKFSDALRRSLHDHAIQVAYLPLSKSVRRDAISFVSGVVKPVAEALAGATVVLLSPLLTDGGFLAVIAIVCLVWLVSIRSLWQRLKTPSISKPPEASKPPIDTDSAAG